MPAQKKRPATDRKKRIRKNRKTNTPDKYALYEESVQTPESQVEWFSNIYRDLRGRFPRTLREDFCGTFAISAEWVRRSNRNVALGLDLDPEPLGYGEITHRAKLSSDENRRLHTLQLNVISETPPVDVIAACNFSFCIFRRRAVLLDYFRACLKSINRKGMLILELAGGPGMIETMRETRNIRSKGRRYTYVWDQKSFDPISRRGHYAIHFKAKDWEIKNAFTYDWRLWTIPELRDAMHDAGFRQTHVYWETTHRGRGTGEYARTETGDNAYSWVTYIVASR